MFTRRVEHILKDIYVQISKDLTRADQGALDDYMDTGVFQNKYELVAFDTEAMLDLEELIEKYELDLDLNPDNIRTYLFNCIFKRLAVERKAGIKLNISHDDYELLWRALENALEK